MNMYDLFLKCDALGSCMLIVLNFTQFNDGNLGCYKVVSEQVGSLGTIRFCYPYM